MKIVLVGVIGNVGLCVLVELIVWGYEVIGIVCNFEKLFEGDCILGMCMDGS